ncbi:MAG: hypothetical protein J6K31_10345 [Parabacteroides sp.]|nr:hypothetical protein [Parabacteroides sp.]
MKNIIFNTVESDTVKYLVKNQVGSVNGNVGYAVQKPFGVHPFLLALYPFLAKQIKSRMSALLLSVDSFLPSFDQSINLFIRFGNTDCGKFFHFAIDFLNDYDSYIA